jgi:class 3 adenylate cyclase
VLVIFICKNILIGHRIRQFRAAYSSAVPQNILKELIRQGKPHPGETTESTACVVAIKDINLLGREDKEKPQDAGKIKKMFFANVKDAVFNSGGIIAGFEGDTIIACFGSPLDKITAPVEKACNFVRSCFNNEKTAWRFGIDAGICSFYWSCETGFSVHGRPAVRARILASRTIRLRVRALITNYVREKLDIGAEKIDSLYENSESIFELR